MKTKAKIFFTILIAVFAIIWQEGMRRLYNINPQIWVFVVYAMVMAGFYLIFCAFYKELEEKEILEKMLKKSEDSKFLAFFNEEYSVEEEQNKMKRAIKRVLDDRIYKVINFSVTTFTIVALIYSVFFIKYFWPSKFLGIIYLLFAMDTFMNAIVSKKEKLFYGTLVLMELFVAVDMFF